MNLQYSLRFSLTMPVILTTFCIYGNSSSMLFTGSIQFPSALKTVPQMFIYSRGSRIQGSPDNTGHKFTYTINRPRGIERFWLAISENLTCSLADQNTVQYWKVDTSKPYRFYSLTRTIDENEFEYINGEARPRFRWDIQTHDLTQCQGKLPDDVVILYYDPSLIEDIRGGSPFEWPTIIVRHDTLDLFGSEKAFHEMSVKLSLAAMDLRPWFSPVDEVCQNANSHVKTIMALSTT